MGKNAGIPMQMQKAMFEHRARRQASIMEQVQAAAAASTTDQESAKTAPNGVEAVSEEKVGSTLRTYKYIKDPYETAIKKSISYFDHVRHDKRMLIPGV